MATLSQGPVLGLPAYAQPNGPGQLPRIDPWLYGSHWGLPDLDGNPPVIDTFTASTVQSIYCGKPSKEHLAQRLFDGLTVAQFDVYVNPSRASPSRVEGVFDYGVVYYRIPRHPSDPALDAPPKNACFLATGVTAYSHLITPYICNHGQGSLEDRRLGIYPVDYEYQRGLAFLGTVADKDSIRYAFSGGALHFVTRTREYSERSVTRALQSGDYFLGLQTGGDQSNALFNVLTQSFPHALSFECCIPIFDARHTPFAFDGGHFSSLLSLPLFHGEVPHGALITVGYTSCIFHELECDPSYLSPYGVAMFFVQFVILHSL
ncbi:hypothetical protein NMY22_g12442 [Coprinellus aureogranulatus]|nr:hypothetical protein NMY22_g12442 [Coprinellus aureogranulatus]